MKKLIKKSESYIHTPYSLISSLHAKFSVPSLQVIESFYTLSTIIVFYFILQYVLRFAKKQPWAATDDYNDYIALGNSINLSEIGEQAKYVVSRIVKKPKKKGREKKRKKENKYEKNVKCRNSINQEFNFFLSLFHHLSVICHLSKFVF